MSCFAATDHVILSDLAVLWKTCY